MTRFPAAPEVVLASENSFDIVSKVDLQEVDNAIHQALKEIGQRWDFRNCTVEMRREAHVIHLQAPDEYKLRALVEVLSLDDGRLLLPFVDACVRDVDVAAGTIVVAPGFADPLDA